MRALFIHPNFPGQFRHLANALASEPANQVVGMGENDQIVRQQHLTKNVILWGYRLSRDAAASTHHYLQQVERDVLRGQATLRKCVELRERGFYPDIICGHAGWGDLLYIREVFPKAKILGYFEFYFLSQGADIGFDPEYPKSLDNRCEVHTKNMTHLLSWQNCDHGWSPTQWQASVFPEEYRKRITVIHEGVDSIRLSPDLAASFKLADGRTLTGNDEIITLINRNMEPYRGFHVFMRTLPDIQRRRPNAHTIIVGDDQDISYGNRPKDGRTWREVLLDETRGQIDLGRLHFVGQLDFERYRQILQISSAHIYLTYPYILSWSMVEAMSCGCLLIASATPPVTEIVRDGHNGLLFDFFDREKLADLVCKALANPDEYKHLRQNARRTVLESYDQNTICIPRQRKLIDSILDNCP